MEFMVLDIETTGLVVPQRLDVFSAKRNRPQHLNAAPDEILQLAIIDQDEKVLFYDCFKPKVKSSWPKAQSIHHISPKDVAGKLSFFERIDEIQSIINRKPLIVVYNAAFDLEFMEGQGISFSGKQCICVMKAFANSSKNKNLYGREGKWQTLDTCASFFGLKREHAHDALADARLTFACYRAIEKDGRFPLHPIEWKR